MEPGLVIILVIAALFIFKQNKSKDSNGLLTDDAVTVKEVVNLLDEFVPVFNDKLKTGFTEADIQKQLHRFLKTKIVHVNREHGIEDVNALKIDFDLGHGKVGIEVKLASQLFKQPNLHRMVGQLQDYTNNKYDKKNLIVFVVGTDEDFTERVYLSKIEEKVKEAKATYVSKSIKK